VANKKMSDTTQQFAFGRIYTGNMSPFSKNGYKANQVCPCYIYYVTLPRLIALLPILYISMPGRFDYG